MAERCDVLVVGAGPAGALAARLLGMSRPNLRIVLLDAETTPLHRPCGEYLAPDGLRVIARAGLEQAILATGAYRLSAVELHGPCGGWHAAFAPVLGLRPFRDHGLGVRREHFDRVLQDGAAVVADLRRGQRCSTMVRDGGRWVVDVVGSHGAYQIETALIIGADGRGSTIRRSAGLDCRPTRKRFALVCRAHGISHRDRVEMHLGPLGQIGLCPLGDGEVNLNLLLAPPSAVLLRLMDRTRLLRVALAVTPTVADRCRDVTLGPVMASGSLPQGASQVVADGVCLAGDAAGFCDPFTGEGMGIAARCADLVVDAITGQDFDRMPTRDELAPYANAFALKIGRRRVIGEALQRILLRRRMAESVAAVIGRVPLLARLMVADAAGFTA